MRRPGPILSAKCESYVGCARIGYLVYSCSCIIQIGPRGEVDPLVLLSLPLETQSGY